MLNYPENIEKITTWITPAERIKETEQKINEALKNDWIILKIDTCVTSIDVIHIIHTLGLPKSKEDTIHPVRLGRKM